MKTSFYLVFSESGVEKMNKQQKPSLKSGQRGVEMVVEIPDAFFEQPFPEVAVAFDEGDILNPSVSVRVRETKERIIGQFYDLFEDLSEARRDYIRHEIHAQSGAVWHFLFETGESPEMDELSVSDLAKALEWVHEQATEKPPLPEKYRG